MQIECGEGAVNHLLLDNYGFFIDTVHNEASEGADEVWVHLNCISIPTTLELGLQYKQP